MKLFIDTADLNEIEDGLKKGVIQGVTTNPSLVAKVPKGDSEKPFLERYVEHIKKIADLCNKYSPGISLSVEVFTENPSEMVEQAKEIVQMIGYENLAIKIPAGWEELQAVRELSKQGINVNFTCCFTESQLLLGVLAGARYVSLFYNRLIDYNKANSISENQLEIIENVRDFIDDSKLDCEIIIGSIRHPKDITDCWSSGAHIVTAGYKHFKPMTKHPKTDDSIKGFLDDLKEWMK